MKGFNKGIAYGWNLAEDEMMRLSSWQGFRSCIRSGKQIAAFGTGALFEKFIDHFNYQYPIKYVYEINSKMWNQTYLGYRVENICEISGLDLNQTIVLIFDMKNLDECAQILKSYHVPCYFSYFIMESQRFRYRVAAPFFRCFYTRCVLQGLIKNSVLKEYEESEYFNIHNQQWRSFYKALKGKTLILFGAGAACESFLNQFNGRLHPAMVIDNSKANWGKRVFHYPISGPDALKRFAPQEIVILITSTVYYNDMAKQICDLGYMHYFSYCIMERNRWLSRIGRPFFKLKGKAKKHIYFSLFRQLPIQRNKIVIVRKDGIGYGCHLKYITQKIIEKKLPYELVWLVNDTKEEFPPEIKKVKNTFFNKVYELSTARLWLDEGLKTPEYCKRKGQYYINTTHGVGVSLKRFGLDAPKTISETMKMNCVHNAGNADLFLSGSKFISNVYKSAFLYDGEVMECGSPRLDIFFTENEEQKKSIKDKYHIPHDAKILMFAPTFRKDLVAVGMKPNKDAAVYNYIDTEKIKCALEQKFGGEWYILFRLHPIMQSVGRKLTHSGTVVDVSEHPDPQELLLITDILLTDYSSIMFDACLVKKVVLLFMPDKDEYIKNERDFYFKLDELPFPVALTNDELCENILSYHYETYEMKRNAFLQPLGIIEDGHASERVVEKIQGYMQMD